MLWGKAEMTCQAIRIPVAVIKSAICQAYRISMRDLVGFSRAYRHVGPRQAAMKLIRELRPDQSLPSIGRHLGGRDHSTVLHAMQRFDDHAQNPVYRNCYEVARDIARSWRPGEPVMVLIDRPATYQPISGENPPATNLVALPTSSLPRAVDLIGDPPEVKAMRASVQSATDKFAALMMDAAE